MADRRAAAFQLRPSNIRVAPLDAPAVDPGGYLVVYRAGKPPELLRGNPFVPLPPEQHDLVPDLDPAVHPEHAGVHRNPPEERPPGAPDQGAPPNRQGPPAPPPAPRARPPPPAPPRGRGRRAPRTGPPPPPDRPRRYPSA